MTVWKYILGFLALAALSVWMAIFFYPDPKLHLIACDVGQGDAILVVHGKNQILIDGGPNNDVLDCLASNMPFWDRKLELVIITHPQTDHFTGIIEVLKRYEVELLLASPIDSSTHAWEALKNQVGGTPVEVLNPATTPNLRLGLIYLDIVHPTDRYLNVNAEQISGKILGIYTTKEDPNDFSVVANLRLGEFDALLTGDIGPRVTKEIVAQGRLYDVDYIKVPHHGSKNGLTEELLETVMPEVAVISAGANNRFGHPHQEVLTMLKEREIKILRTDQIGEVEIITDGINWWVKN